MDETGTDIWLARQTRRSGTSDRGIVRRPLGVHVLQFLECFDRLLDRTGKGGAVLVVKELVNMAGNSLALVLGCAMSACLQEQ